MATTLPQAVQEHKATRPSPGVGSDGVVADRTAADGPLPKPTGARQPQRQADSVAAKIKSQSGFASPQHSTVYSPHV